MHYLFTDAVKHKVTLDREIEPWCCLYKASLEDMILWVERKKIKKMASLVTVWGKHCKTHGDERLTSKQYKVLTQQEDNSQQKLNRGAEKCLIKGHTQMADKQRKMLSIIYL